MTKIKPNADYVLVKGTPPDRQTESGLIIPETARDKSVFVEVVAVGPGLWLEEAQRRREPEVRPGDVAVLTCWGLNEIQVDGEDYLLVREHELLAVVTDPTVKVSWVAR